MGFWPGGQKNIQRKANMGKKKLATIFFVLLVALGALTIFSVAKRNTSVMGVQSVFSGLTPQVFRQELQTGKYKLLDIRTIEEYKTGHLVNAEQIDFYQTKSFSEYLDKLDKNKKYLIYCRSGNRTSNTLKIMKQKGFTQVWELDGGYNAWIAQGLSIEN